MQQHSTTGLSRTRRLSLIASFAALYTVLRIIPSFPMIGVSGMFSASDFIAPLYGILLGPYIGGASIIIGTFLAISLGKPMIFLGLDFLPAATGAITMGLLMKRKFMHATAIYIVILLIFVANPLTLIFVGLPNGISFPYNWLHIIALVLLISPLSRKAIDWISNPVRAYRIWGMLILCLIGTMIQHITGGLLFESVFGLVLGVIQPEAWPAIWTGIFFVYPVERAVITVVAALIGAASYRTLRVWLNRTNIV